jgi:WhiB family redox-sensing transcriptional regulator
VELEKQLDWRALAACRGMSTSVFFPPKGKYSPEAHAACRGCAVRPECMTEAIHSALEGVWGGTTEQQRRSVKLRQIE